MSPVMKFATDTFFIALVFLVIFGTVAILMAIVAGIGESLAQIWYDWRLRAKQVKREAPSPGAPPPEPNPDKWTVLANAVNETILVAARRCQFGACPVDVRPTCCLDCPDRKGCDARCMDCAENGERSEALQ